MTIEWIETRFPGYFVNAEAQVRKIRQSPPPHNKSALAREFGISRFVIYGILNGSLWKEVV